MTLEATLDMIDKASIGGHCQVLSNEKYSLEIEKITKNSYWFSYSPKKTRMKHFKDALLSKEKLQENIKKFLDGKKVTEKWFENNYTNQFEATVRRKRGRKRKYSGRHYIIRYYTLDGVEDEILIRELDDSDTNFYSGDKILIEKNMGIAKITNLVTGKSIIGAIEP